MKRAIIMILLALAAKSMAQQVRVIVQVIEVPHAALTKWTGAEKLKGHELHDRAVKLAATGEAEIVDTSVLIARSGEKAVNESITEVIYPSEYEPPGYEPIPLNLEMLQFRYLRQFDAAFQSTFETRNAGALLEIEPTVGNDGALVELRLSFEIVDRVALTTWTEFVDQWGDASVRMPVFETQRITGALSLVPGTFELFNVFTPKPAAVPAAAIRQLVFVRADVLTVAPLEK